jgi:DNA-binding IclR family transcriptional regulator
MPDTPAYPIRSVDHALIVLDLFAQRQRASINQIAREIGVSPSTASRLVAMLVLHGYVERDESSRAYVIGPKLHDIGIRAIREREIREQARPHIEAIAAETGETTQLAVLAGQTIVFLDGVEGRHPQHVASYAGPQMPAHSMASGKALLAELPPGELLALYPTDALPHVTAKTVRTREQLLRDLRGVKLRGYATSRGEARPGVSVVAVPVRDALGHVRASLGIAAPAAKVNERIEQRFAGLLVRTAGAIGKTLS